MNRRTRLRRTGILCIGCLRNAAYYRAFNAAPVARRRQEFWRALNGNFIDTCLMDWCKLFGDAHAKHHWSKSVSDPENFLSGLHAQLRMNEAEFEAFRIQVRAYRDKFLAHLDAQNSTEIPRIQPAIDSVRFLYDYLVTHEDDQDAFHDAPAHANAEYQRYFREGREAHRI